MKRTYPIVRILLVLVCMLLVAAPRTTAAATRQGLSTDEAANEALVLRFLYEGVDQRTFAVLNAVLAPTFVSHSPFGTVTGIPAYTRVLGALVTAFPDIQLHLVEVAATGDTVVVRDFTTATQKGAFLGSPATGKKVGWTELQLYHLSDGKVIEQWVSFDALGILNQIKGS
jgi:predicted ester cyclase